MHLHTSDPSSADTMMVVRKRNGTQEPMDLNKIVRAISRAAQGIPSVDPSRVAIKTIAGVYPGITTKELDQLSIQTAASLLSEEPSYSKLAAALQSEYIRKEVEREGVHSFSQSVALGHEQGLISDRLHHFVKTNSRKLNNAIVPESDGLFEYFGIRTVYDRYLLRHPETRKVIETPQYFFMRVAAALSDSAAQAIKLYRDISGMYYMPSTPTLFNAGTRHEQMSSCYLHAQPHDSLEGIYEVYGEIARNSKFAGGIGTPWGSVRSTGSLIRGTNGMSNGITPWLKTLDSSVSAVNQGGKRKGAACVYLPSWHADIEEFLELRDSTGDHARRTHNLNLANWIPDLFMEAVESDGQWHLFDPNEAPELLSTWGPAFREAYSESVTAGKAKKVVKARDLYGKMMKTLAETGMGWMCFSDRSNKLSNQTLRSENMIQSSNLCTEILEVVRRDSERQETAVCNLASIVLPSFFVCESTCGSNEPFVEKKSFDFAKLREIVKRIMRQLDTVIDRNFYPIPSAEASNKRWRPVGLGVMGLQDLFFLMGLPFDSPEAQQLSTAIQEEIYYAAMLASADLAEELGPFPAFEESRTSEGVFQFDLWGVEPPSSARWNSLRERIKKGGLRNSLAIAIAPTATIGSITGVFECVEPQVSNLLKRETLSGEFLQVNRYLVADLKRLGLWTEEVRTRIKMADGSIQGIEAIPAELRHLYRTAWELSQKSLIELAAARGPYIDQSQSLNLFIESPTIGKLSSMYLYAWKLGLKTTYYLRARPATKIAKTTVSVADQAQYARSAAVSCSLENPSACEACQ